MAFKEQLFLCYTLCQLFQEQEVPNIYGIKRATISMLHSLNFAKSRGEKIKIAHYKKEKKREEMSDYFPLEVVLEILVRLPVKSLLECRCVSKTWHSIISDPTFITTHLSRTLSKTNNNMVLFHYYSGANEHFSLHLDDTNEKFTLNYPNKIIHYFLTLVGSCNGLLCLADGFGFNIDYTLWNPLINKLVTVPPPNISLMSHAHVMHSLGFGFDAVNNDYKLVRIVYVKVKDEDSMFNTLQPLVEIFSLRSGSWRNVSAIGPMYVSYERSSQAFVNGACHWVAHSPEWKGTFVNVIVSFDLEKEVFSEMKLPESLVEVDGLNIGVAVLGGSLALVPDNKWWEGLLLSVWAMKKYGDAESWTKLFNIDLHGELRRVVGFRKTGEVLVVTEDEKLLSFDPKNQEFSDFGIRGHSFSFYLDTYVESLVLLNETNGELRDQANSSNAGENKNKKKK